MRSLTEDTRLFALQITQYVSNFESGNTKLSSSGFKGLANTLTRP